LIKYFLDSPAGVRVEKLLNLMALGAGGGFQIEVFLSFFKTISAISVFCNLKIMFCVTSV
jgi:hypothetical protein